ncbi:MAG: glutamate dehydrogenase [Oligoflexia bacterium]|nr:MAG: glutamate dehydrogenase [Oligoflexia bacterium]
MAQDSIMVEDHLRHPLFQNAMQSVEEAGKIINADPNIINRLKKPKRCIIVSVPVRMDDSTVKVFSGYRVQYNSTLGPYKGGIRYHQDVCLGEVVGLASLMMLKNSLMGLPYGGGKGGITVDPTKLSRTEKQNLTRRYTSEIGPFIGPQKDIPAPDVGTDSQTMAWMMDTYSQETGYAQPGVVTGKPIEIGGSLGRTGATGLGAVYVAEKAFEKKGMSLKGATIAVQGFGNVGSHAALYAFERGAKIVAISDVSGGLFNGDGLNIPDVIEHVRINKSIAGYSRGQKISNEDLLLLDVDALFPCALEGVITEKNAEKIKAKIIIEGANGPVTNDATKILHKKGVFIAPDVIANGGGVVVSYFEWVQDIMSFFWDESEINNRLKGIITKAFDRSYVMAQEKNVDMRQAAMAVSVERLQKAMLLRGLYPR